MREYLEEVYKIAISPAISPKAVFRAALNSQLISQAEFNILLLTIDDRNLTSHTYNEELAEIIGSKIKDYCLLNVNSTKEKSIHSAPSTPLLIL